MDLYVKQFTVRYQGKDYGPGSIIYGVEQKLAENLIDGSNKTIEALPERETTATSATTAGTADVNTDASTDTATGTDDSTATLPSVDPKKTVK